MENITQKNTQENIQKFLQELDSDYKEGLNKIRSVFKDKGQDNITLLDRAALYFSRANKLKFSYNLFALLESHTENLDKKEEIKNNIIDSVIKISKHPSREGAPLYAENSKFIIQDWEFAAENSRGIYYNIGILFEITAIVDDRYGNWRIGHESVNINFFIRNEKITLTEDLVKLGLPF